MDIVARHAQAQPDKVAVIDGDHRLTWHQYHEARNRLAHALSDLGLAAGEHVVLYAHNSLEVLLASAAARALGLIPVPMNHRLTAEEVAYILDDSDAVAVFASDAFVPMLERVRAGAPRLRHVVLLGGERRPWAVARDGPHRRRAAGPGRRAGRTGRLDDLHRRHDGQAEGGAAPGDRSARDRLARGRAELRGAHRRAPRGRAALSLGARRLRALRASLRPDRRGDAQVRSRGGAAAHRRAIAAPPPSWPRRC